MATQLTLRKGTKIQNDAFTGAEAEMTYVSTTKGLRIHDGSTQGGIDVPTAATADYVVESQTPTAENNFTWYRKYRSGWVEQGQGNQQMSGSTIRIDLPIIMSDSSYNLSIVGSTNIRYQNVDATYFEIVPSATPGWLTWEVKGFAA